MLRSILFILSLVFISFSCTEIVFDEPQPLGGKNMRKIPEALLGDYSFVVVNEQQVIHITKDYFDTDKGRKYLSDSLILRKMGNKYVINQLISDRPETKGKWSVFTIEEKGCGFLKASSFIISEDEYVTTFTETHNATLAGGGQEKQLIINPKSKEVFEKISEDKNATLSVILEKIED